ncbi:MAG: Gx transporter family protein [Erysipelotrichaceae bacterium]|nr:Gx transporter family protein [Erysipelotrichaceae bacterium]
MKSKKFNVHRIAFLAVMLALAILLGYVESLIPNWVPGVKPGLANLVVLILLYTFPFYDALLISLLRVFLVALIRGSIFQLPFYLSLGGAILSFVAMLSAKYCLRFLTVYGVSLLGAYAHGIGQLLVAAWMTETWAVFYYFPFISLISLATGLATAFLADRLLKSAPIQHLRDETSIS